MKHNEHAFKRTYLSDNQNNTTPVLTVHTCAKSLNSVNAV